MCLYFMGMYHEYKCADTCASFKPFSPLIHYVNYCKLLILLSSEEFITLNCFGVYEKLMSLID